MKRGTVIKCIKDVLMEEGFKAFTKGKYYKTYPYWSQEGNKVTCAKNDQKNRHIILDEDGDSFFNMHFEVTESN